MAQLPGGGAHHARASTTAGSCPCWTRPQRPPRPCGRLPQRRDLPGPDRRRRRRAVLADHSLRPPRSGAREPGRSLRLDRDRRDPRPAGADPDRRGEVRGKGHRPAAAAIIDRCDDMPPEIWEPAPRRDAVARVRGPEPSCQTIRPGIGGEHPIRPRGGTRRPTRPSTRGPTRSTVAGVEVMQGRRGAAARRRTDPTRRTSSCRV